jgi:isoleucyl-tRNA synthetase
VRNVTNALETYDVLGATRPIQAFVDDLSKWYLRRSRRRYWKSESDADKDAAYATLYEVLVTLAKLLAPTMPFLAEELYQNLVRSVTGRRRSRSTWRSGRLITNRPSTRNSMQI